MNLFSSLSSTYSTLPEEEVHFQPHLVAHFDGICPEQAGLSGVDLVCHGVADVVGSNVAPHPLHLTVQVCNTGTAWCRLAGALRILLHLVLSLRNEVSAACTCLWSVRIVAMSGDSSIASSM